MGKKSERAFYWNVDLLEGFFDRLAHTAGGMAAITLWVLAGSWCAENNPDGIISSEGLRALTKYWGDEGDAPILAQALVEVGLWKQLDDGGHEFTGQGELCFWGDE